MMIDAALVRHTTQKRKPAVKEEFSTINLAKNLAAANQWESIQSKRVINRQYYLMEGSVAGS